MFLYKHSLCSTGKKRFLTTISDKSNIKEIIQKSWWESVCVIITSNVWCQCVCLGGWVVSWALSLHHPVCSTPVCCHPHRDKEPEWMLATQTSSAIADCVSGYSPPPPSYLHQLVGVQMGWREVVLQEKEGTRHGQMRHSCVNYNTIVIPQSLSSDLYLYSGIRVDPKCIPVYLETNEIKLMFFLHKNNTGVLHGPHAIHTHWQCLQTSLKI